MQLGRFSYSFSPVVIGSRQLDGGMHFGHSLPASQELCSGIGGFGVDHVTGLLGV